MTQEQKRIKIAEAYGWTSCFFHEGCALGKHPSYTLSREYLDIPEYFKDLNACQDVVFTLTPIQVALFQELLSKTASLRGNCFCELLTFDWAEAIGLTLGLWKEGE